jgi:methyl-accepting chemotaxis protein
MAKSDSLTRRLAFIRLDERTCASLRRLRPLIARALPVILDDFYAHVAKYPELSKLFAGGSSGMRHAKAMQIEHWDLIAAAAFDESYVRSVTAVGEAHNRLGLEPRWYIGGYSLVLTGLLHAIESETSAGWFGASGREDKATLREAITRAALLDMDFAISVYLEAGKRDKRETLERVASAFEATIGQVVQTVAAASTELESSAKTLTHTAHTTAELSNKVAAASDEASTNVGAVASATEQLGASINEISRQVQDSSRIAQEAVAQAERTDSRITELSEAAQRIGNVVKLITAIAEQTNLLALNATIEAARAGEAGRGFAVVAQEVKALAAQTAKATDEIGTQISGMQAATQQSVADIKEIGTTIARISQIAAIIAAAVEEQGAATREIAHNVQLTAQGAQSVAANVADVKQVASETGSASGHVLTAAGQLSTEGTTLRREVDKFLATVRTA